MQTREQDRAPGIRVFVYGTLKKGHGNWKWFLDRDDVDYLGRHVARGPYVMRDLGYFPAVVRHDDMAGDLVNPIVGEVYRVPAEVLDALDVLEGHPDWYKREQIPTPWKMAWMYFMPGAECDSYEDDVIESGCWNASEEELDFLKASGDGCSS